MVSIFLVFISNRIEQASSTAIGAVPTVSRGTASAVTENYWNVGAAEGAAFTIATLAAAEPC